MLSKELKLSIKYQTNSKGSALSNTIAYMNAGKQCDIIYTDADSLGGSLLNARNITWSTNYSSAGSAKLGWVPYPHSDAKESKDICRFKGLSMMLPKKTAKPENVCVALKFAELWATRFTEAIFDNLQTNPVLGFSSDNAADFYNFALHNVTFSLTFRDLKVPNIQSSGLIEAFEGTGNTNIVGFVRVASELVNSCIEKCMDQAG